MGSFLVFKTQHLWEASQAARGSETPCYGGLLGDLHSLQVYLTHVPFPSFFMCPDEIRGLLFRVNYWSKFDPNSKCSTCSLYLLIHTYIYMNRYREFAELPVRVMRHVRCRNSSKDSPAKGINRWLVRHLSQHSEDWGSGILSSQWDSKFSGRLGYRVKSYLKLNKQIIN